MAKGGAVEGIIPPDPSGESPPFPISLFKVDYQVSLLLITVRARIHLRVDMINGVTGWYLESRRRTPASRSQLQSYKHMKY